MNPLSRACLALALCLHAGCAASSAPPGASPPSASEPPFRSLTVPAASPDGPDREVRVVLDAPHLKIVSIALRRGAVLPEHVAPVPVVIQAASGAGTVTLGDQRVRLDASHPVLLAPRVPHAVEPDAGADLTLLVLHLRGTRGESTQ